MVKATYSLKRRARLVVTVYVHCVSFAVTGLHATLTIVLLWYLSDDHGVGQAV